MDRLNTSADVNALKAEAASAEPDMPMSALRQKLVELRRQARLHEHKALSDCLALAISLTSNKHVN